MLIVPLPAVRPWQKRAWPHDNQHVTIQAGEIIRARRLFESPMVPLTHRQARINRGKAATIAPVSEQRLMGLMCSASDGGAGNVSTAT